MNPVEFPERTHILNKPDNMTDAECNSGFPCQLEVALMTAGAVNKWISVWELTEEEFQALGETRKIKLEIYAPGHPPVSLSVINP